jgi:hypothetical protein
MRAPLLEAPLTRCFIGVDAASKIASSVAVGAQAVLAIAQGNQDRGCGASVLGNHLPERKGGTHGEAI